MAPRYSIRYYKYIQLWMVSLALCIWPAMWCLMLSINSIYYTSYIVFCYSYLFEFPLKFFSFTQWRTLGKYITMTFIYNFSEKLRSRRNVCKVFHVLNLHLYIYHLFRHTKYSYASLLISPTSYLHCQCTANSAT